MKEQDKNINGTVEVDVKRLAEAVWHRIWIVAIVTVLCGVLAFVGTFYLITPEYESSAMFYVNNTSLSVGDASISIDSGDITASKNLVNSYIVILNTRTSLNEVIDYTGVDYTYKQLSRMISAASVNSTEIFEVVVTSHDPAEAEKIANAIAYILPKRISSIVEGTSAKVVDTAVKAAAPSSPNYTNNTLLGLLIGIVLSVGVIVLQEIFDTTIRTEEDIMLVNNNPVLASVPDMSAPSKGGYYYGYGRKRTPKKYGTANQAKETVLIGNDISFAASEAYKLLRTKLQYSFADENSTRIIGVSSALTGEGKSLTAVNLAHTLSQLDKKVLLIDCDMRRPSLPDKLPIRKRPGLSGYLSGQNRFEELLQNCGIAGSEDAFKVISSGQNPPNPIELLSSARMTKLLDKLRESYDYVVLDLPPVGEVSDAMAVAKNLDGILVVVRQNYCTRPVLSAAVRQFEFVDSRILGIVYNCTSEGSGRYGRGYYKKYYRRGYRKYEGSYLATATAEAEDKSKGEN